jgi:hypothetical protein
LIYVSKYDKDHYLVIVYVMRDCGQNIILQLIIIFTLMVYYVTIAMLIMKKTKILIYISLKYLKNFNPRDFLAIINYNTYKLISMIKSYE